jgi:phosphatidylglycerophosphatase B
LASSTALAVLGVAVLSWLCTATGSYALRGAVALVTFGVTESGGLRWAPLVLLGFLGAWAAEGGASIRRRQLPSVLLLLLVALPATALVNERALKPRVAALRPSHLRLAEAGVIPDRDAFERLHPRHRRAYLQARIDTIAAAFDLHPVVLRHWVHESSFSFPSSHAVNAFAAATLCAGAILAQPSRRRRLAHGMLAWAVAVAWSRVLLQVHRPVDVIAGAAAGALLGALLLLAWKKWCGAQKSI